MNKINYTGCGLMMIKDKIQYPRGWQKLNFRCGLMMIKDKIQYWQK